MHCNGMAALGLRKRLLPSSRRRSETLFSLFYIPKGCSKTKPLIIIVRLQGVELALRSFVAAGANRVWSAQDAELVYDVDGSHSDERFEAFLASVRKAGIIKFRTPIMSAHQVNI